MEDVVTVFGGSRGLGLPLGVVGGGQLAAVVSQLVLLVRVLGGHVLLGVLVVVDHGVAEGQIHAGLVQTLLELFFQFVLTQAAHSLDLGEGTGFEAVVAVLLGILLVLLELRVVLRPHSALYFLDFVGHKLPKIVLISLTVVHGCILRPHIPLIHLMRPHPISNLLLHIKTSFLIPTFHSLFSLEHTSQIVQFLF